MTTDFEVVSWRKRDAIRLFLYRIFSIISLGMLPLFCFYFPVYFDQLSTSQCDPSVADLVIIEIEGKKSALQVNTWESATSEGSPVISIELDSVRYFALSVEDYRFRKVRDVPRNYIRFLDIDYVSDHAPKEMIEEQTILKVQYGLNTMKIPETSFVEIAIRHMLSPFYLFQYFAASVWYAEDYWLYATLILIITFAAIYVTTRETISNLQSLRILAGSDTTVQALPAETDRTTFDIDPLGRDIQLISDRQLLPGRKFKLTENMTLPCDAVLIAGKVVMDESMLTGESVPVSKVPIDRHEIEGDKSYVLSLDRLSLKSRKLQKLSKKKQQYADNDMEDLNMDNEEDDDLEQTFIENAALRPPNLINDDELAIKRSGSVLFGGTRVKACYGNQCIVVVYRTGFRSAKGMLVASLLKPKEGFINFISDALWVLLFMVILSTAMYCAVSIRIVLLGAAPISVFYYYLDTITIAVPPALTACLTVATAISIARLKKAAIFVSETSRVNFAGVVNAICFDKTGTLTEEKLTFVGYQTPVISSRTGVSMDEWLDFNQDNEEILPLRCQEIMATCHALSLFGFDEELTPVGDPLEVELLKASGWDLKSSSVVPGQLIACPPADHFLLDGKEMPDEEYKILKHFEFTPDRLRAASIVQEPSGHMVYLMKGSPEVIIKLCSPSTVPHSIHHTMAKLTKRGFRVIAVAYRDLKTKSSDSVLTMTQEECEAETSAGQQHIVFAGLLYLSNELKKDSRRTIRELHRAQLHTNMITGDHVFTAIAVAKQCQILIRGSPQTKSTSSSNTNAANKLKSRDNRSPLSKTSNIIKPTETDNENIEASASGRMPHYVLIIDENDVIKGELSIKDYDSGLLVDIDLHRCAVLAAKTVYRTIIKRFRQKHAISKPVVSPLAGLLGSSLQNQQQLVDDSDGITTDAERTQRAKERKNKVGRKSSKQQIQKSAAAGGNKKTDLNPSSVETYTPFATSSQDETPSSPSISLNASNMDISLMSFTQYTGLGAGYSSILPGGIASSTTNNICASSTLNNAPLNNSSVHSVRSTASSKSGNTSTAGQLQQPYSLLHHNRHVQSSSASMHMNTNSPTSSHHSLLSLRHLAPSTSSYNTIDSPLLPPSHFAADSAASSPLQHGRLSSSPIFPKQSLLQIPSSACIELAITGKALHLIRKQYSYTLYQKLIRYARVFARMKPHDKREVVEMLLETLEYKQYDMSLQHMNDEEGVDEHDNDHDYGNHYHGSYFSDLPVPKTLFGAFTEQETKCHTQLHESDPVIHDRGNDSGDDNQEISSHHQSSGGIAGTIQDRRRRKAAMLTSVQQIPTAATTHRRRSLSAASASNPMHTGPGDIIPIATNKPPLRRRGISDIEDSQHEEGTGAAIPGRPTTLPMEDADEHAAASMLYPTLLQSQYEHDLEAQDYPPIHHPNFHHPSHHPLTHHQVGDEDRSRTPSFSTISTQQSTFSTSNNQRALASKKLTNKSKESSKKSKRMKSTNTSSLASWLSAISTDNIVVSTLSTSLRSAYKYSTSQLAGAPPSAEPLEVLFCGDGANDMIALRAATVGISLCDAETSVAAPITSRQATPYAVVEVLREGRCSLITAYVLILFNIMYGTIQLFMVCTLYFYGLIPGNYMYLQQDLCYTLVLGLAISYSLPSTTLDHLMPPKRFLSRRFLVQLSLLLISFVVFQVLSLALLSMQDFYSIYHAKTAFTETYSYEASTAQAVALGQLMIASVVSSLGEPFRLSWHSNPYHLYALSAQGLWLGFQIFAQDNYLLQNILQIKPVPFMFGCVLISLLILNAVVAGWVVSFVEDEIAPMTSKRWFQVCAQKQRHRGKWRREFTRLQSMEKYQPIRMNNATTTAAAGKETVHYTSSAQSTPLKATTSAASSSNNRQLLQKKRCDDGDDNGSSHEDYDGGENYKSRSYNDRQRLLPK